MTCCGFIYIWYDKARKMFYIGSHLGNELDRYICSSKHMLKEYKKRPHDFKRKILEKCTSVDILYKEQRWLDFIKSNELYYQSCKYYNVKKFAAGGDTTKYHPNRTDIIKKRYGIKHSDAIKKSIANRSEEAKKIHRDRQKKSLKETLSKKTDWYQAKKINVFCNNKLYNSYNSIACLVKDLKLDRSTIVKNIKQGKWIIKHKRKHPFNIGDIITFS